MGKTEIDYARTNKLFPQDTKNPVVTDYVNRHANNLARDSDLDLPLNIFVVRRELKKDARPILGNDSQPEQVGNVMAPPGGFLVIYAGMILTAENEKELAGAISCEMAHYLSSPSRRKQRATGSKSVFVRIGG